MVMEIQVPVKANKHTILLALLPCMEEEADCVHQQKDLRDHVVPPQ